MPYDVDAILSRTGSSSGDSKREKLDLEEWKECRTTIGRFDTLIGELRKYGFTLITGLLTATSFWFSNDAQRAEGIPTSIEAAVAIVLTFLIVALFVVDRSYEVLLWAAVVRGSELEQRLDFKVTQKLSEFGKKANADTWAAKTYGLFVLAAQVPWVLSWLKLPFAARLAVLVIAICGMAGFAYRYHRDSKRHMEELVMPLGDSGRREVMPDKVA